MYKYIKKKGGKESLVSNYAEIRQYSWSKIIFCSCKQKKKIFCITLTLSGVAIDPHGPNSYSQVDSENCTFPINISLNLRKYYFFATN